MQRLVLALPALAVAVALSACNKPVPPTFAVATPATEVGAATTVQQPIVEGLSGQDPAAVGVHEVGGVRARMAYDGGRFIVELEGTPPPSDDCPVIAYLAQDAGGTRWEHRFGEDKGAVLVGGDEFGGKAPRTRIVDAAGQKTLRFYLPTLPGDFALHVEADADPGAACALAPALPTITGRLNAKGGLTFAAAAGPVVAGVRAPDTGEGPGSDSARYQPGDAVQLVGANLAGATAVDFSGVSATPSEVSAHKIVLSAPSEGDLDGFSVVFGDKRTASVAFQVEGTVDRIGDAMGTFSGAVWGTWLVVLLVGAGLIFTLAQGFPQFRGFWHAIKVVRGDYDNPDEKGEITHFQALTAALSATVGLGNIAGVAVAVTNGGPGAIFWMWVCGFLGMATKFTECALSTAYRNINEDGTVSGGPMYYMKKELPKFLAPMAVIFGVFITIASFGGGNMFQANQAAAIWEQSFGLPTWATGLILVGLVGLVIVGGIKRIGSVTDKLVPIMCGVYVLAALAVIFTHLDEVPGVFSSIFTEAFNVSAAVGGVLGIVIKDVIVQGFRRAAFSNEAGFGSAAIAHSAVKTDEPVREGVVALLEPFIDTVVICTMTALVILLSGAWTQQGLSGVNLTAVSFDSAFEGFGSIMVPVAVFLFAISTMISWSYYGEKGVEYVFGRRAVLPYRLVFIGLIFIGAVWKLGPVLDFSDAMLGLLVVPNMFALLWLTPKLRTMVNDYFGRLKSGEMKVYRGKKGG